MKIGDKVKLVKKTFLHNGVFIFTNSFVEIENISETGIDVIYIDKEGFSHHIKGLKEKDIQLS